MICLCFRCISYNIFCGINRSCFIFKKGIVTAIVVLWISLEIVVEIIADINSDKVWFLVREVVSIALGIVVTISDKVWVNFTIVVGTLFCIGSSLHAVFPSEFSTHSYVSESVTG